MACLSAHGWVDLGTHPRILVVYIEALIGFSHVFSLVGLLLHITLSRLYPWRALTVRLEGRMCTYTSRTGQGPEEPLIALVQLGGHLVVMSFWWAPPIAMWTKSLEVFFFSKEKNEVGIATRGKNKRCSPGKTSDVCCLTRLECKECHKTVFNSTWLYQIKRAISSKDLEVGNKLSGGNWNLVKLEEWVGIDLIKAILEVTE